MNLFILLSINNPFTNKFLLVFGILCKHILSETSQILILPSSSTEAHIGVLLINLQSIKGTKCPSNFPLNELSKDKSVLYK